MKTVLQVRLSLLDVESKAFRGTSLVFSPGFSDQNYCNLIITEHLDPGQFHRILSHSVVTIKKQVQKLRRLIRRIRVIISANREQAYSFTGSHASARGLALFTRIGVRTVWAAYPNAGISRNVCLSAQNPCHSLL